MNKTIESGDLVTVSLVGKLENGMVFTDSSEDGPVTFKVGDYDFIRGLNTAVMGMGVGEKKNVTLKPVEAFGEYDETLLIKVPCAQLPENPQKGMQLKSATEDGQEQIWTVRDFIEEDEMAILDGNHILAGQSLQFDLKVVEINDHA